MLAAAGGAGLVLGALKPSWQVAIEPAQVIAGLVVYPDGNPFHLYQTSLWTLWHPVLAALLSAGLDERVLSIGVSGVLGALSFAALATFARAQGAGEALSIACPFLVLALDPLNWGFRYPIWLIGSGHSYGMAGLSVVLLAVGLLGAGRWAAGSFLLGLSPAIHASLGASVAAAAAGVGILGWRMIRPHLRALVSGGAIGASLAAVSLIGHLLVVRPETSVDPAVSSVYLDAFVRLWDAHRVPLHLTDERGWVLWCGLIVALCAAAGARPRLAAAQRISLAILLVCAGIGIAYAWAHAWLGSSAIPSALVVAMPTRLLNLVMIAYVPLLIGLLWSFRRFPLAGFLLATLSVSPLVARHGSPALVWLLLGCGVGVVGLILWARRSARPSEARSAFSSVFVRVAGIALAASAIWISGKVIEVSGKRFAAIRGGWNDPVLAAASRSPDLLAVGPGISQAQLLTRRPILLDPTALDMLPYALAGGPALRSILDGVYGIDYFRPPVLHRAALPILPVKRVWERRSVAEWSALAARFGFTEVLVLAPWRLNLPEQARNDALALYRIP